MWSCEAIGNALDEHHDKPERMRLEPWLYRLALEAIDGLAARIQIRRTLSLGSARDTVEQVGGVRASPWNPSMLRTPSSTALRRLPKILLPAMN